ncbi:hypothetical protein D9757_004569 [Collybiopsis confluens]|uniref:Uncharacterized protein n=1 Tax=Collybiopsis confluens TaxID=2823264 RepID=A0A8H5HWG5_9AGAR|nr:hypothetical protein D9757_004569 [Collybiopsis confluens]
MLAQILLKATDDSSGPKLCPGLYFVRISPAPNGVGRIIVLFWPKDMTWDDGAISSVQRNRITFISDLIIIEKLSWRETAYTNLRLHKTYVPTPKVGSRAANVFQLPIHFTTQHIQLLKNKKCLLVINTGTQFPVFCKRPAALENAICISHGKSLHQSKLGNDVLVAFNESTRTLAIVACERVGTSSRLACFVSGVDELLLADSQGQLCIFAQVTQQFRPATVELDCTPLNAMSSPDGSCEQSVGKSFALNHLADTSFAGSAMRTTAGMFQSFQSSSTVLDPKANPTLFQSTLVIIIKDAVKSDTNEIVKERAEQDANFISKLHTGRLNIIPWPVIEFKQFYTLFPVLKARLDTQKITHRSAGEFLQTLKTMTAKLKANNWGALSETIAAHWASEMRKTVDLPTWFAYSCSKNSYHGLTLSYTRLKKHGQDITCPIIDKVIEGLKAEGVTKFAATGFCFGARGALINSIYKRSVVLTAKSRVKHANADIINHISTDLGPLALAGFALFPLAAPLQERIMAHRLKTRKTTNKFTEQQAKLLAESLVLAATLSFVAYAHTTSGGQFNPAIIFSLSLFQLLRQPMMFLPRAMSVTTDAQNAFSRLVKIFEAKTLDDIPFIVDPTQELALNVTDASFQWEVISASSDANETDRYHGKRTEESAPDVTTPIMDPFQVRDINMKVPRRSLVAIVGGVGSGKVLLQGLVGEMRKTSGEFSFGGRVAYVSQTAWIMNATLRNNILFGQPFDETKYWTVLERSCLIPDLQMLPDGDLTEIGEKGINLSGVWLSKASESDSSSDIRILVDAHVGRSLFYGAIQSLVAEGRTVILVTHALHFLSDCDYIYTMDSGRFAAHGTYPDLIAQNGEFARLDKEFGGNEPSAETRTQLVDAAAVKAMKSKTDRASRKGAGVGKLEGKLMVKEKQTTAYLSAGLGWLTIASIALSILLMQGSQIVNSYTWDQFGRPFSLYDVLYAALGIFQACFTIILGFAIDIMSIFASKNLQNDGNRAVMYAPMSFFDTTPMFGKDIDTRAFSFDEDESLTGLPTIRSYGEIPQFVRDNKFYIDLENRALFLTVTNQRYCKHLREPKDGRCQNHVIKKKCTQSHAGSSLQHHRHVFQHHSHSHSAPAMSSQAEAIAALYVPDRRLATRSENPSAATKRQRERREDETAQEAAERKARRSAYMKNWYLNKKAKKAEETSAGVSNSVPQLNGRVVRWNSGSETILSYKEENGMNICPRVTNYVEEFARMGIHDPDLSDPLNPFYFHDMQGQKVTPAIWNQLEEQLALNRVVVLRHCGVNSVVPFDAQAVKTAFGLCGGTLISAQDMMLQEVDSVDYSRRITVDEFFANGSERYMNALDVKLPASGGVFDLSLLCDGPRSWLQTDTVADSRALIPQDTHRGMTWALMSHAGSHTCRHVDGSGCATYATVSSGQKFWGIIRPADPSDPIATTQEIYASASDQFPGSLDHCRERFKIFYAELNPGDTIIQPPFVVHTVYTPVSSIVTGGHFHAYKLLHLTEVARHVNRAIDIANTDEDLAHYTLIRMAIALPLQSTVKHFCRRDLVALAAMILWWEDYYEHSPNNGGKSDLENIKVQKDGSDNQAVAIAQAVLALVGFKIKQNRRLKAAVMKYLRSADWSNSGEEISVSSL